MNKMFGWIKPAWANITEHSAQTCNINFSVDLLFYPSLPPNLLPVSVVFITNCPFSFTSAAQLFQGKRLTGMPVNASWEAAWCCVKCKQEPLPALIHTHTHTHTCLASVARVCARLRRMRTHKAWGLHVENFPGVRGTVSFEPNRQVRW